MANKEQLKSIIVSLGTLAIRARDQLSESHDQGTYINLLDKIKQLISNVEQASADISEEMTQVDEGEVCANLSNARSFFFFFFFMNGNTERAQCALSLVCIPQEMEKSKTSL